MANGNELSLVLGTAKLGTLTPLGGDFPWTDCSFVPTDKFEVYRCTFDEMVQAVDARDDERTVKAMEKIYALGLKTSVGGRKKPARVFATYIKDRGGRSR